MDRKRERHIHSRACGRLHCHSCDVDEMATTVSYRICYECNHVWETSEQLVMAHNLENAKYNLTAKDLDWPDGWMYSDLPPLSIASREEEVFFCPLCTHDF